VITIGVISDTHGLLRVSAVDGLRGSDHIIHAGDVGSAEILDELRCIAPVIVVRGNVDSGAWAKRIPLTEVLEVGGVSIYVIHILQDLDLKPEAAGFAAVVYGHSHKPEQLTKNGVLYFNPGSAGPRRFTLPISLGRLVIEDGEVRSELITIVE
jgi:putative phosphoesterase